MKFIYFVLFCLLFLNSKTLLSQCTTDNIICQPGTSPSLNFVAGQWPMTNPSSCLLFEDGTNGPPVPSEFGYALVYISTSGLLNMVIEGSSNGGWLDVALFDVTGLADPCLGLGIGNEIACNLNGNTGGCAEFGSNYPCTSEVAAPFVNAGDVILILTENFIQSSGNSYTVTVSTAAGSAQVGPPPVTVNAQANLSTTDAPITMVANVVGGSWSSNCGACIDASTGIFDPSISGVGTFQICYNVGIAPCLSSNCTNINVTGAVACDATITASGPFCTTDASINLVAVDGGGTWSGTGITDGALGTFDPATALPLLMLQFV